MDSFRSLTIVLYIIVMICSLLFIINVIFIKINSRGKHSHGLFIFNCTVIVFSLATIVDVGTLFYKMHQYSEEPIDEDCIVVLYDDSTYSSKFLNDVKIRYADKKGWDTYYDAVKVTLTVIEPSAKDLAAVILTHDFDRLFSVQEDYIKQTEQYEIGGILSIQKRDGYTISQIDNFYFKDGELATEHTGLEYQIHVAVDTSKIHDNVICDYRVIESKYLQVMEG